MLPHRGSHGIIARIGWISAHQNDVRRSADYAHHAGYGPESWPFISPNHGALFTQAKENTDFRQVLSTAEHTQLVLMTLRPGEDIGAEVHRGGDQILVNIEGDERAVLDGVEYPFVTGDVAMVPEGLEHNIVNTGTSPMRLAMVYAPPAHRPGVVHHTKGDAQRDKPPHSP